MKRVPLKKLENSIIKPGFEEHLRPLLRYKGNQSLGRIHRMWNLMVSAMEHEASVADITQRLGQNAAYSQLCGPEKRVTAQAVGGFVGRLRDHPDVGKEMPQLLEYFLDTVAWYRIHRLTPISDPPPDFVRLAKGKTMPWVMGEFGVGDSVARRWFVECGYEPVHAGRLPLPKQWASFASKENNIELARRFDVSTQTVARWRSETGVVNLAQSRHVVAEGTIVYPFVIHDGGKPEHALLRKVNGAVPKHLDPVTRADICQDLVVGILCGDFSEDDLDLPAKEMTKRVFQMFPTKYGPVSLDDVILGTDDMRLVDRISEEDSLWARI
jgi:hypothetical protein